MTTLSDKIRQARYGAVHNPYQGGDKKVLFVCSMGILRSATGSRIYGARYNTRCAGTYEEALIQISVPLLTWANEVVFVHQENYDQAIKFLKNLGYVEGVEELSAKSRVLHIPDNFEHMHPEIIKAYNEQYEPVSNNIGA